MVHWGVLCSAPWKQRFHFCHYEGPLKPIRKWKLWHCRETSEENGRKMLRSTKALACFFSFLFLKTEHKDWEALFVQTKPDHKGKPLKGCSAPPHHHSKTDQKKRPNPNQKYLKPKQISKYKWSSFSRYPSAGLSNILYKHSSSPMKIT